MDNFSPNPVFFSSKEKFEKSNSESKLEFIKFSTKNNNNNINISIFNENEKEKEKEQEQEQESIQDISLRFWSLIGAKNALEMKLKKVKELNYKFPDEEYGRKKIFFEEEFIFKSLSIDLENVQKEKIKSSGAITCISRINRACY